MDTAGGRFGSEERLLADVPESRSIRGDEAMAGPVFREIAVDVSRNAGEAVEQFDRFDDSGRSRLAADPIALPFPEMAPEQALDRS